MNISVSDWGSGSTSLSGEAVPSLDTGYTPSYSQGTIQGTIQVAVRVRPMVAREIAEGSVQSLAADEANKCVSVAGLGPAQSRRFTFDHVFGPESAQVSAALKAASLTYCSALLDYKHSIASRYARYAR